MKLYHCEKCNYKCNLKQSAQKHLKSKKHINGYKMDEVNFRCEVCIKEFKYKSHLRTHKKSMKHKRNMEYQRGKIDFSLFCEIIIIK